MKNKRGFTLVELLAVIVVLAIIALIGYTIVGDVISGAQESADKENVREYARSVRLAITSAQMNGQTIPSSLNSTWLTDNVEKTGNEVVCSNVTDNNGTITLTGCSVGGSTQKYCYDGTDVTTCTRANNNIVKIYGTSSGFGTIINLFNLQMLSSEKLASGYAENIVVNNNNFMFTKSCDYRTCSSYIGYNVYLDVGTYVMSGTYDDDYTTGTTLGGWAVFDKENNTFVKNNSGRGFPTDGVFTITQAKEYRIAFYIDYNSTANTKGTFTNVQLETGNTATSYEPYGYKIPITAEDENGNEQIITVYISTEKLGAADYLSYDGANWKVVRNGVSTDPVKVLIGSSGTDAMPTGKVTYLITGLPESNFVYNYE